MKDPWLPDGLPEACRGMLAHRRERVLEALGDPAPAWWADWTAAPERVALTGRALAASAFVAETVVRDPAVLASLAAGDLLRPYTDTDYREALRARLDGVDSEEALHRELRRFRCREMLRIVWRDLTRLAPLEETTRDVSLLAEACVQQASDWLYVLLCRTHGTPMGPGPDGEPVPQHLVVLGMGKLGARELNVSSDIDLIFAYPETGETVGGRRALSNHEFFMRLGQRLIQALDTRTVDGFVFRMDMRLRPYGQSGALALSFDAMEEYYQNQGRDWERYAMIKARVIAGPEADGARLMDALQPFIYRRYIDFSAIEALRDMKALITREVNRQGMDRNIKLGAGGIREIEFIAQSFQLIRGGREPALRERSLQRVLTWLGEHDYLPADAVAELQAAYRFLRDVEHALQGDEDKQTQTLPEDETARERLAWVMGFESVTAFETALAEHRAAVSRHFSYVAQTPEEAETETAPEHDAWRPVWRDELEVPVAEARLRDTGYTDPAEALTRLRALREGATVRMMQTTGRERLDRFMPQLLAAVAGEAAPDTALMRLLPLVEAVLRRTAYLVLLMENPGSLARLIHLCAASPWIAGELARHPALLDELLDPRTLYSLPDPAELADALRQHMLRVPEDDLEAQMEQLRYFKRAYSLRVAACEVTGDLPLMAVSDHLTWLAEAILQHVLAIAWADLLRRHGAPAVSDEDPRPFVIVAYGKLGGIELGHGSDLDLVFLYDAPAGGTTAGERPVDNAVFFTRLGQRIIHILGTQMAAGRLYEVDMRLRPSGESGLLVSSLAAFDTYQIDNAWTWEHQALIRARPVAGSGRVAAAFARTRETVLCRSRDAEALRAEVVRMRQRMREHLAGDEAADTFPLKQGRGGIVDIEFMVQYAVLAWAKNHPSLTRWTDNVRLLETLTEEGLWPSEWTQALKDAYLAYRSAIHRLALAQAPATVDATAFVDERARVAAIWDALMENAADGSADRAE